jgi:hypothetical protein
MFMLTLWCDVGLSYDTDETTLKDAFFQHGDVLSLQNNFALMTRMFQVVDEKKTSGCNT